MNFDNLRRKTFERQAAVDSRQVTPRLRRELSANERNAVYHAPGTALLFCVHGKSFFEPCSSGCRRNKKEADMRLKTFLTEYGE